MPGPVKSKKVISDMSWKDGAARVADKASPLRWSIDVNFHLWIVSSRQNNGIPQQYENVTALRNEPTDGHRQVSEIALSIGPPTNRRVKVQLRKMVLAGDDMTGLEPHAALVQFADRTPPWPTTAEEVDEMQGIYRCQQFSCRGLWL